MAVKNINTSATGKPLSPSTQTCSADNTRNSACGAKLRLDRPQQNRHILPIYKVKNVSPCQDERGIPAVTAGELGVYR